MRDGLASTGFTKVMTLRKHLEAGQEIFHRLEVTEQDKQRDAPRDREVQGTSSVMAGRQ